MARQPEHHPKDDILAHYVDALQTGTPVNKDDDMEIRQLEELADRLYQMSGSYPTEVSVTTRQRMEVFSVYRQHNRQRPAPQNWLARLLDSLGQYPTATAIGMVAIVVLTVIFFNPGSAGGGFSATAGLGSLLVPAIAFGLLLLGAVIYSLKRRK